MVQKLQQFDQRDYELLEREPCFEGFFKLDRFVFRHKCFDGRWSSDIRREVFVRGPATCVLPYDPARDCVVLLEQFRVGALLEDQNPWLIELVAGINEPGEQPEDVARREAVEEAGLKLGLMEHICDYLPSPGACTEKVHLYCARIEGEYAGGLFGLPEEDEDIRTHVLTLDDARELLASGTIDNAPAIIALQWLLLNHDQLRKKWQ